MPVRSAGRSSAIPNAGANAAHGSTQAVSKVSTARLRSFNGMRADHTPGRRLAVRAPTSAPDHSTSVDTSASRATASSNSTRCAPSERGDMTGRRVGREMVEAVHEQDRLRARGDELVDDHAQARDRSREIVVGVEARGGEVTLGQLPRAHRRSVGRGPPVERAQLVELGAVARASR